MAITVTCLILGLIGFVMAGAIYKLERSDHMPRGLAPFSLGTFSLIAS